MISISGISMRSILWLLCFCFLLSFPIKFTLVYCIRTTKHCYGQQKSTPAKKCDEKSRYLTWHHLLIITIMQTDTLWLMPSNLAERKLKSTRYMRKREEMKIDFELDELNTFSCTLSKMSFWTNFAITVHSVIQDALNFYVSFPSVWHMWCNQILPLECTKYAHQFESIPICMIKPYLTQVSRISNFHMYSTTWTVKYHMRNYPFKKKTPRMNQNKFPVLS